MAKRNAADAMADMGDIGDIGDLEDVFSNKDDDDWFGLLSEELGEPSAPVTDKKAALNDKLAAEALAGIDDLMADAPPTPKKPKNIKKPKKPKPDKPRYKKVVIILGRKPKKPKEPRKPKVPKAPKPPKPPKVPKPRCWRVAPHGLYHLPGLEHVATAAHLARKFEDAGHFVDPKKPLLPQLGEVYAGTVRPPPLDVLGKDVTPAQLVQLEPKDIRPFFPDTKKQRIVLNFRRQMWIAYNSTYKMFHQAGVKLPPTAFTHARPASGDWLFKPVDTAEKMDPIKVASSV